MKKLIVVFVLLFAATTLFAQVDMGSFPTGSWLDHNYDAIWTFAATGITLKTTDGSFTYSFGRTNMENFRLSMTGIQPTITFSCQATERTYVFRASLPSTDIVMEIDNKNLPNKYSVTMKKQ